MTNNLKTQVKLQLMTISGFPKDTIDDVAEKLINDEFTKTQIEKNGFRLNFRKTFDDMLAFFDLSHSYCLQIVTKMPSLLSMSVDEMEYVVDGMVRQFERDGLTWPRYRRAALENPVLFTLSPRMAGYNIGALVKEFPPLTRAQALSAALSAPELFDKMFDREKVAGILGWAEFAKAGEQSGKPTGPVSIYALRKGKLKWSSPDVQLSDRADRKIDEVTNEVVARFAHAGLSLRKYLRMAEKSPQLLTASPDLIERHINATVEIFAPHLTLEKYLKMMETAPRTLSLHPETIERNIKGVVEKFAPHISLGQYIKAAEYVPQLLCILPETIERNIKGIAEKFAPELSFAQIVKMAISAPSLFTRSPDTLEGKMNEFTEQLGSNRAQYLQLVKKYPNLLAQSSDTVVGNIKGVVEKFEHVGGPTLAQYTKIAMSNPWLFSISPRVVERNIMGVVEEFRRAGLTLEKYIKTAAKAPLLELFSRSPDKIISNINGAVEKFAPHMPVEQYLHVAMRTAMLFTTSPDTVERNIKGVVEAFTPHISLERYLRATIVNPALLTMKSETIISRFNLFVAMNDKKAFALQSPAAKRKNEKDIFEVLCTNASFITFSENRLLTHYIAARLWKNKGGRPYTLRYLCGRPRDKMEDIIIDELKDRRPQILAKLADQGLIKVRMSRIIGDQNIAKFLQKTHD